MAQTSSAVTVQRIGDVDVIRFPHGDVLDLENIREVRRHVGQRLHEHAPVKIVLDMGGALPTSEAMGMIVVLNNMIAARGGRVHLSNISEQTCAVFEVMRVGHIVEMFNTTQEATERFA